MKSLFFFLVLIVTLTLIYLSLMKTSIKIEFFENPTVAPPVNTLALNNIATKLNINPTRIHNFKETGDITNTDQYQIYFEIYPRNVTETTSPMIKDLLEQINKMSADKDSFDVKTIDGNDVFLAKIQVEEADRPISGSITDEKVISQFVDPSIEGQLKYLKYKKVGVPADVEMDPRYKFEGGSIVLEPIPTYTPSPTDFTPSPTDFTPTPTTY